MPSREIRDSPVVRDLLVVVPEPVSQPGRCFADDLEPAEDRVLQYLVLLAALPVVDSDVLPDALQGVQHVGSPARQACCHW